MLKEREGECVYVCLRIWMCVQTETERDEGKRIIAILLWYEKWRVTYITLLWHDSLPVCESIWWKDGVGMQTVTYVVWRWQRVLVFEGQAGELRGVVGRSVTVAGVAVETHCSITWEEEKQRREKRSNGKLKWSCLPGRLIRLSRKWL